MQQAAKGNIFLNKIKYILYLQC